jgi:hypothetical protein
LRGSLMFSGMGISRTHLCAHANHKSTINILFLLMYLANFAPESHLMEPPPRTSVE